MVGEPESAWQVKGKGHQGGAGESRQGLAGRRGACKGSSLFVDQMQLVTTALSRDVGEAVFQIRRLERNKLYPLLAISPVDPPGQALSERSVAVVDHCGLPIGHGVTSVRAIGGCMVLGEPEQLLKFLAVKSDHHLAVDERDRRRPHPEL